MRRLYIGFVAKTEYLTSTLRSLYGFSHLHVSYDTVVLDIPFSDEWGYQWHDVFSCATKRKKQLGLTKEDVYIVVLDQPDECNWFSAWVGNSPYGFECLESFQSFVEHDTNVGFVHADDWNEYGIQEVFGVLYQVARLFLEIQLTHHVIKSDIAQGRPFFEAIERNEVYLVHEDALGCINDMCVEKQDVLHKIRTADVCAACFDILRELTEKEYLPDIFGVFDLVRDNVVNARNFLVGNQYEEALEHPAPIAFMKMHWQNIRAGGSAHEIIRNAVGYFEYMVKYTCTLLYAENKQNWMSDRPSLGHWVGWFTRMSTVEFGLHEDERRIIEQCTKVLNAIIVQGRKQNIVEFRNDNIGHGQLIGFDHDYSSDSRTLEEIIDHLEDLLVPIWNKRDLFHYSGGMTLDEQGRIKLSGYNLRGNRQIFSLTTKAISMAEFNKIHSLLQPRGKPFEPHRVLVWTQNKTTYSLAGYIEYRTCHVCEQRRLTMRDGEYWLDVVKGHRIRL